MRAPTTVACGALDVPCLVIRRAPVAERVPGATFQVLPELAHLANVERPQAIAMLVEGCLRAAATA